MAINKYLDKAGLEHLGEVLVPEIKSHLKQYATMPTPSYDYLGKIVQYAGADTDRYFQSGFYICQHNGTNYEWVYWDAFRGKEIVTFGSLSTAKTKLATLSFPNENIVFIKDLQCYYTYTGRNSGDTEEGCIFVSDTHKLVPFPMNGYLPITWAGGRSGNLGHENSQLLVKAIKHAVKMLLVITIPSYTYYIDEEINISSGSLRLEGVTSLGNSSTGHAMGSCIAFVPEDNSKTLFTTSNSRNTSIKHVNFYCPYTTFSGNYVEVAETPHNYFTWSYEYTDVNCLNLVSSSLYIEDVSVSGFSGYGVRLPKNCTVKDVRTAQCKYGFYECATDVLFHGCFARGCEYGFYWSNGTVLFMYDTWIDQCGYGVYSGNELSGEFIGGEIDHCLYAGFYSKNVGSGLKIVSRFGRLGMYYLGTDMKAKAEAITTYTDADFDDMSKGVDIAIRNAEGLDVDVSEVSRYIADNGTGTNKLPTLFAFGNRWRSAIIKTVYDFGENTYHLVDTTHNDVTVVNVNTNSDVTALPTPTSYNVGKICTLTAQQTGYIEGGIYKCEEVTPSTSPKTYYWKLINGTGDDIDFSDWESGTHSGGTWSDIYAKKADVAATYATKDEAVIQYTTMPTPSVDYLGKIVKYIGETDANYTHGFSYECVADGESTPTYSWILNNAGLDYITPEMYGAVGDGTTDDTQAFHDAIMAANGMPVYVPQGTYIVSSCDVTGIAVNLIGIDNPVIKYQFVDTDYTGILDIHNAPKISITGITFDGDRLTLAETKNVHCVWIYNSNNVSISNCVFQNVSREATTFWGECENIFICKNTYNYTSALVWFTGDVQVNNVLFDGNFAYNTRTNGFEMDAITTNKINTNITISNNHFVNVAQSAIILSHASKVNIVGNYIVGSFTAISFFGGTLDNNAVSVDNVSISNNFANVEQIFYVDNPNYVSFKNIVFNSDTFEFNSPSFTGNSYIRFMNCSFKVKAIITSTEDNSLFKVTKASVLLMDSNTFAFSSSYKGTNRCIFKVADNDASVELKNSVFPNTSALYTLENNYSKVVLDNVEGNFGDIIIDYTINNRVRGDSKKSVNNANTIQKAKAFQNTSDDVLVLPKCGDFFLIDIDADRDTPIQTITTLEYLGKEITIYTNGHKITLANTDNIVTKNGSSTDYNGLITLKFYNSKWYVS